MIAVDTSAILAILLAEEEAPEFRDLIGEAGGAFISAGTAVELAAVASCDDDLHAAALTFLNEPLRGRSAPTHPTRALASQIAEWL